MGGPYTSNEGDHVPISFAVTNIGPSTATKVVVTDTLGSGWQYLGAATGQGTFKQSGGVVTFSIGTIASGQTVNMMMNLQALEEGNLTTTAVVSSNVSDPNTSNNTAVSSNTILEPPIVVSAPITVTGKNQSNVQVATFTHASGVEPAGDFIATINWGDGTTSTGSISLSGATYKVKGSHTYAQNISHTVTTTVVESEAAAGSALIKALATNQATTASLQSASTSTVLVGTPSQEVAPKAEPPATTGLLRLLPAFVDRVLNEAQGKPSNTLQRGAEAVNDDLLAGFFAAL